MNNRHHPYAGGYEHNRRGGPAQGGFGPDRPHRYSERGGPARGRGGYRGGARGGGGAPSYGGGGYDGNLAYDQGPPQGDIGGYNSYDSAPAAPQDPYYQNGSYNAGIPAQYGSATDASGSYDQNYGNYNEGALDKLRCDLRA